MRIVCCNKYYFLNGGTERYLNNIMRQLTLRGHEAIPFSVAYAGSWDTPYAAYFMHPPGDPAATTFRSITLGPDNIGALFFRSVYSFYARRRLAALLDATRGADAAYLLNIYNYMSPSILHTFRKRNIRVVMRLGDYHLVCPSHSLMRDKAPCTLCVKGDYYHGLKHRCVHGSLAASGLRVLSMYVQRILRIYDCVDAFVAPCVFMRDMLVSGGFPAGRIAVIPQPADEGLNMNGDTPKENTVLYFGRVSEEKGLDLLLEAFQNANTDAKLQIVGRSYDGCAEKLKTLVRPGFESRIEFIGFCQGQELSGLVGRAMLSVVPSRCHDNAPQSVVESYLHSTPVLGAKMGGIPEQIVPGVTGELFDPASATELRDTLARLLADPERLTLMGRQAREYARTACSVDAHMDALLPLFEGRKPN